MVFLLLKKSSAQPTSCDNKRDLTQHKNFFAASMIHTAAKFEPTATQLLDKIAHLCQSKDASWNLIQSEPCRFDSLPPPPAQGTYRIHGTIPVAAKTLFAAVWDTKNSIALSTSLDKDFTLVSFKEHAVPMEIVYHQHRSPSWGVTYVIIYK